MIQVSLKHLGDDLNCQRCFEESLKQNENDVEARINYVLFLYLKNNRQLAMKHYSHFQQVLSVTSNIDKEVRSNIISEKKLIFLQQHRSKI